MLVKFLFLQKETMTIPAGIIVHPDPINVARKLQMCDTEATLIGTGGQNQLG